MKLAMRPLSSIAFIFLTMLSSQCKNKQSEPYQGPNDIKAQESDSKNTAVDNEEEFYIIDVNIQSSDAVSKEDIYAESLTQISKIMEQIQLHKQSSLGLAVKFKFFNKMKAKKKAEVETDTVATLPTNRSFFEEMGYQTPEKYRNPSKDQDLITYKAEEITGKKVFGLNLTLAHLMNGIRSREIKPNMSGINFASVSGDVNFKLGAGHKLHKKLIRQWDEHHAHPYIQPNGKPIEGFVLVGKDGKVILDADGKEKIFKARVVPTEDGLNARVFEDGKSSTYQVHAIQASKKVKIVENQKEFMDSTITLRGENELNNTLIHQQVENFLKVSDDKLEKIIADLNSKKVSYSDFFDQLKNKKENGDTLTQDESDFFATYQLSESLFEQWKRSKGHRKNMENPAYDSTGTTVFVIRYNDGTRIENIIATQAFF